MGGQTRPVLTAKGRWGHRMSLYDVVLGDGRQHERRAALFPGIGNPEVDRFRDCWAEKCDGGSLVVAVYTRIGGTNRRDHGPCIYALQHNPYYIRDADDSHDSTYATFYFRVENDRSGFLARQAVEPVDMSERWREAIKDLPRRIREGRLKPAEQALVDQLKAGLEETEIGPPGIKIFRV